jgi:hypothetical protein
MQIVLAIVTTGQVNSQELCPSVCQCNDGNLTCADLYNDVTNMTQETFHQAVWRLRVTGRIRLEVEEDLFLRRNITSLTYLDLSQNNITKTEKMAFYCLVYIVELHLYGNSITTFHSQTFKYNTRLVWLSLKLNNLALLPVDLFKVSVKLQ